MDVTIEELRHAYRVPAEIMELALPLLARIAPDVEPPLAYRQGGALPRLVQVGEGDDVMQVALQEAAALAELEGLIAVIAPRSLVGASPGGLEFDHVVVVEPAAIAEDGEQGLRQLYVALTRPTKTLVVVHARPLPHGLGVGG